MTRTRSAVRIAIALLALPGLGANAGAQGTSPAAPGASGAPAAASPAERMVFVDPQLRNVKPPTTLRYSFARSGSLEPALNDDVRIELRARPDGGCCAAEGRFLSGQHAVALPPIDDAQSNPVILFFLEHDVREMQRRTGGQHGALPAAHSAGAGRQRTRQRRHGAPRRPRLAGEGGAHHPVPRRPEPRTLRALCWQGIRLRAGAWRARRRSAVAHASSGRRARGQAPLIEETVTLAEQ